MPGRSLNHLTSRTEVNSNSEKMARNMKVKNSLAEKFDSKNDKAQPGNKNKINTNNSSTSKQSDTNDKSKPEENQKKSLNFNKKRCISSNSLSPSKLPPPPSPPYSIPSKSNSKNIDDNHDENGDICDISTIIFDKNKRKSSINSLKCRKSSIQTNKSTPDANCCSTCSSGDVNEITLKIKSCQNCSNVAIDQISYSGQTMCLSNDIISALTGQNSVNCSNQHQNQHQPHVSAVQQCYHHLANITQKLKNMYKNQIHTSHSQSSSKRSSIVTIPEQDIPTEYNKIPTQLQDGKQQQCNSTKHFHFSVKKTSNAEQPQIEKQSYNSTLSNPIISSKPNISSTFNNSIKTTKANKMQNQENSSNCNVNGDVLVLKICDLDHSSNLSSKTSEKIGTTVETNTTTRLDFSTDSKYEQKSLNTNNSNNNNNNNNNEISFIKKDCRHGNFNFLQRQSSVDAATSPSLCSPVKSVTVFNLSPDEIKVEKVTSPIPIVISPTYFSETNKHFKSAKSYFSESGKISPSQLVFPKTSSSNKGSFEKRSPKNQQLTKSPSGLNYQSKQSKAKISRKTQSLQGDDISTNERTKITISKSYRKIMVMSEYHRDKTKSTKSANKNTDFLNSSLSQHRNLLKKSKLRNNEISKSLDIFLPSDILNDFSDLPDSFFNFPPYTLTSKSTSNLNAMQNDFYDDDEGPFEHINSVELIFISDEFLNKAVKHDLKIINCTTDLNEKVKSPIEIKVSKPNVLSSTSSSKTNSKTKLQKNASSSTESKAIKTPDSVSGGSSRKNSISPSRPDKPLITKNLSDLNIGTKKLIVISEDFKRKSLENTVIIINQNDDETIKPPQLLQYQQQQQQQQQQFQDHSSKIQQQSNSSKDRSPGCDGGGSSTVNSSSDCIDDNCINFNSKLNCSSSKTTITATKRKNLKDLKSWGRESSVDDVGNQMVSHAFCSAEEPDELCLENKEIAETLQ